MENQLMSIKPALPKGTHDFLPQEMLKREHIIGVMERNFKKFGFAPIATPAMENFSTLTGKYGEEGDRLMFKILKSGNFLKKVNQQAYREKDAAVLSPSICDKALRYDLTVPFSRFIVQHQNDILFPFKRYQIQPVWRADRPQKGRFREFYQCDADTIGSNSLLLELDFIALYDAVFSELKIPITIKLNDRKILVGIAENLQILDRLQDFTIVLDKLDKIGLEGIVKELAQKGFGKETWKTVEKIAFLSGSNKQKIKEVEKLIEGSFIGMKGLEGLRFIVENTTDLSPTLEMDITLVRGLDYYTGTTFEVKANKVEMSSIGGGGRYDDLTGIFGLKNLSGIGISFGLDRIQLVMEELDLFPDTVMEGTEVLLINFGEEETLFCMKLVSELRNLGVRSEVYPDNVKLKKQMDYANKKNIPYVVLIGAEELKSGKFTLKEMANSQQYSLSRVELLEKFTSNTNTGHGKY